MHEHDFYSNDYRPLADTLVDGILGLSAPSMVQYIKFVTEQIIGGIECPKNL